MAAIIIGNNDVKNDDPFNLLDSLIPPQKPTQIISEEEFQKMTHGL